jgi:putative ABC transport system permease protein
MSFLESLIIGLDALHVNKMRSVLTVLGVIVGVAAVVCMVSVGSGVREEVSEKIRTLGANLLLVRPGTQSSGGARLESGSRPTLTEEDASAIRRELRGARAVAPLLSRSLQVIAGNKNWATLVAGVNGEYLTAREWHIASGRTFTAAELEAGAKVAVVGSIVVDGLFPGSIGVGETLRIGNVPFTVIGTLEQRGQGAAGRSQDDVIFIPLATAKSRVVGAVRGTSRSAMDFILIKASDQLAIPHIRSELTSLLRERHHLRQDALGGILGVIGGCIGAVIIAWQAHWPVLISPEAILLSCAFAGLVGIFFGFYPAYRASRLDPITALRFE